MKQKIVFLDRDGVVIDNSAHYYVHRQEDVKFVKGIFENLQKIAQKGYKFIIISNQSGIAKGEYTIAEVNRVHDYLKQEFARNGLDLIDDYFCPHHPSKSACLCRKPDSLLLEKAITLHQVDFSQSFLIGDSERDMQAAHKIGLKAFKIEGNTNLKNAISLNISYYLKPFTKK